MQYNKKRSITMEKSKTASSIRQLSQKETIAVNGGILPLIIGSVVIGGAILYPKPAHHTQDQKLDNQP